MGKMCYVQAVVATTLDSSRDRPGSFGVIRAILLTQPVISQLLILDFHMFNFIESTLKSAASVVTIPVSVVADVVTLGGALTDKDQPYTADAASDLMKNIKDIGSPGKG